MIGLPKPDHQGPPLETTLRRRRSVRDFSDRPLSIRELSQLIFAAQGVTGSIYGTPLRAAPSAGALYPFEMYPVVSRVNGLRQGIYRYVVDGHGLEPVAEGDFRGRLSAAALRQGALDRAAVTFVLSAVAARTCGKYGKRGIRYIHIEAGHISQNIALQAVALGLGSVTIGAFHDDRLNELIGADGSKETAVYLHAVGRP